MILDSKVDSVSSFRPGPHAHNFSSFSRIIAEAGRHSVAWIFWILCYISMEFYSLAHVRSQQSRWIFPRVTLLLNAGAAIYAFWWPWAPQWLLVSLVLWSHFTCLGPLWDVSSINSQDFFVSILKTNHPWKLTWNLNISPLDEERHLQTTNVWGSMLVFRGVHL